MLEFWFTSLNTGGLSTEQTVSMAEVCGSAFMLCLPADRAGDMLQIILIACTIDCSSKKGIHSLHEAPPKS